MPRARNIKPGFFTNDELVELPAFTRLLFIGLWTLADREGRLEDRPKRIKMYIFPADMVDVDESLTELAAAGFLERYSIDGRRYIQIVNFHKHQKPHHRERASSIPPMPTASAPDGDLLDTGRQGNPCRSMTETGADQSPSTDEAAPRHGRGTPSSGGSPSDSHDSHDSRDSRDSRDSGDSGESGQSRSIPKDFTLTDYRRAYLKRHARHLDPEREFEEFRNHHQAKGSRFKNWDAAWRTWCTRSAKYNPPPKRAPVRKEL